MYCYFCGTETGSDPNPCSLCDSLLESGVSDSSILSLFRYNPFVRELILKVKLKGYLWPLEGLLQQMIPHVPRHIQGVMPCPSHPISRLKGKTDLAYLMAERIHQVFHIPLIRPPYALYSAN